MMINSHVVLNSLVKMIYSLTVLLDNSWSACGRLRRLTLSAPHATIVSLSHLVEKVLSHELFSAQSLM